MRAGRLRQRVTLQQKVTTGTAMGLLLALTYQSPVNSYGEEVVTWQDVATVWGSVEPLRGQEFLEAKRLGAEVTTRIVIRYRSGVVPEMRATYDGHDYDILSVIHVEERGRELQLMCREVL